MNMFCIFVEILDTIILVRQDKKRFSIFWSAKRTAKFIYSMLPNNFRIVSGLKEFIALLKYM